MKLFKTFLFLAIATLASGCANLQPMALKGQTAVPDLSQESIALFTLKTSNKLKPGFQPFVRVVYVKPKSENAKSISFQTGAPYKKMEDQYNEYLVSIKLKPGTYTLQSIFGMSTGFLINGSFVVPVYTEFEIPANKIAYLGRLEAVNRRRNLGTEPRAGSVIPLIDQRVTGYAGGTFDVTISDNYDQDMQVFKKTYPFIANQTVDRAIMPQWKARSADEIAQLR